MKIVHVTPGVIQIPPNGWGAIEKMIWEYHQSFLKMGHQSDIVYLDQVTGEEDIVHIHVANLANMAHERGIPYYFTMSDHHTVLYGKDSLIYKQNYEAVKNAKKAFVGGKFLVDYFDDIPEYVPYGVNPEYFMPTPRAVTEHRLLCVANNGYFTDSAYDRKGFGPAIAAAKQLGLPITIAGPSNNKNYFEKNPPDYDKLTILYDLDEQQLLDAYNQHTIFLHPSELETGHPNLTLLEAMACGLPVVGTIEPNNVLKGMEIATREVDSLVTGIKKVIDNYGEYASNARKQAEELSWFNAAKTLVDRYQAQPTFEEQLMKHYTTTPIVVRPKHNPKAKFLFSNIHGMRAEILGGEDIQYKVRFINNDTGQEVYVTNLTRNTWAETAIQYYVNWKVVIEDANGNVVHQYFHDVKGQKVYIAIDSKALGDTLAWVGYAEEFRKQRGCKVVCSTFWNDLFVDQYPEIEFVKPGIGVDLISSMYLVGIFFGENETHNTKYHPVDPTKIPLQQVATDILGLPYTEVKPRLRKPNVEQLNQVSIGIHATAQAKYWNNPMGWQAVVDYLRSKDYKVKLLSREEDGYMGNNDPYGVEKLPAGPIQNVIEEMCKSKLYVGVGSGLGWLSWALDIPTIVISGFTPHNIEPTSCIRISAPQGACSSCWSRHKFNPGDWNWCPDQKGTPRQFECSNLISSQTVIQKIDSLLNTKDIQGWFAYQNLYDSAVESATGGETFVEIGAWLGKSTNYMATKIRESGKRINFTTVDTWKGTEDEQNHQQVVGDIGGDMFPTFIQNTRDMSNIGVVNVIKDYSHNASTQFANNSIDFLMIDGGHSYESVITDLSHWYHKVKPGAIISGDDYGVFEGVTKAANQFFRGQITVDGYSFVRRKPRIQIKHLLTRPNDLREIVSVQSIRQLQQYGIDYQPVVNQVYEGLPPVENCRRPTHIGHTAGQIGDDGLGVLTGRHYGCYLAHRNAIASMDDVNYDYTLIFEADAFIFTGVREFADAIHAACFMSERDNVYQISFANNYSGEMQMVDTLFAKTAHYQDLAHCYLVANRHKNWWLNAIQNTEWDSGDLWLNHLFYKFPQLRYTTNKVYSKQADGLSLLDNTVKTW